MPAQFLRIGLPIVRPLTRFLALDPGRGGRGQGDLCPCGLDVAFIRERHSPRQPGRNEFDSGGRRG